MADISTRQNLEPNIQRLAAQRYLYSCAKRISAIQATLAGATPVLGVVAIALCTEAQPWASLAGIVVALLNRVCLDSWQDRFRKTAAQIQEDFDCRVIGLPWNQVLVGQRLAVEEIHEAAKKARSASDAPLQDWYPAVVDSLPMHQARVVCQRTNCWWDAKLRRRYRAVILTVLGLISVLVFLMFLQTGINLQKFVLSVAAPLLPTLLWGFLEARRQKEAATALDRLKHLTDGFWQEIAQGQVTEPEATHRSRELQNAIWLHRRTKPFVFDWIYRKLRRDYEEQMNVGAEDMVDQVNIDSD